MSPNSSGRPGTFAQPVDDTQSVFRAVLEALSHPGQPVTCPQAVTPPEELSACAWAWALALLDGETTVALAGFVNPAAIARAITQFTQARVISLDDHPDFLIAASPQAIPPLAILQTGTDLAPDESVTLVVQAAEVVGGAPQTVRGPGIAANATIAVAGLPEAFWTAWDANAEAYPKGVDVIFADETRFVGLPRSVRRA